MRPRNRTTLTFFCQTHFMHESSDSYVFVSSDGRRQTVRSLESNSVDFQAKLLVVVASAVNEQQKLIYRAKLRGIEQKFLHK